MLPYFKEYPTSQHTYHKVIDSKKMHMYSNTLKQHAARRARTILQYLLFQQTTSKHFKPTAIVKNFQLP